MTGSRNEMLVELSKDINDTRKDFDIFRVVLKFLQKGTVCLYRLKWLFFDFIGGTLLWC